MYIALMAREESSHPFLWGFSEFPKEIVRQLVLDRPYGDVTHGSALVKSSQEKALSVSRHIGTTQPYVTQTPGPQYQRQSLLWSSCKPSQRLILALRGWGVGADINSAKLIPGFERETNVERQIKLLCPGLPCVVGWIMVLSKDVHNLIQRTYEYVTLHNKRDFVDVTTLRILSWDDYPGLHGCALSIHTGPCKKDTRGVWVREKEMWKQKQRDREKLEDATLLALKIIKNKGGRGGSHKPKNVGGL